METALREAVTATMAQVAALAQLADAVEQLARNVEAGKPGKETGLRRELATGAAAEYLREYGIRVAAMIAVAGGGCGLHHYFGWTVGPLLGGG